MSKIKIKNEYYLTQSEYNIRRASGTLSPNAKYIISNKQTELPLNAAAGEAMVFDGNNWTTQSGYGYATTEIIASVTDIEWHGEPGCYESYNTVLNLSAGTTYKVQWGNNIYTCIATAFEEVEGICVLGELDGYEPSFTNYPFCIEDAPSYGMSVFVAESNDVTSCYLLGDAIQKIDMKYIPDIGLPEATQAGQAVVYDGESWALQDGYGYFGGNSPIFELTGITWDQESSWYAYYSQTTGVSLTYGKKYTVVWDDEEYEITASSLEGMGMLGEYSMSSGPIFDTYPFCIVSYASDERKLCYVFASTNTVTGFGISGPTIQKFDSKYIDTSSIQTTWGDITGTLSNQTDLQSALDNKENISNKVTSLSSSSTNTQYPSAKCVYDKINSLDGNITNSPAASKTLTSFSEVNGIVSATFNNISITESQVTNLTTDLDTKENTSNKVTSWSSTTTNTNYPSEKLVKDSLDNKSQVSVSASGSAVNEIKYITIDGVENKLGGGTWGGISGTLSEQTDLQTALDNKANSAHTHRQTDIIQEVGDYLILNGGDSTPLEIKLNSFLFDKSAQSLIEIGE